MKGETQNKALWLYRLIVAGFGMFLLFNASAWADDGDREGVAACGCEKVAINGMAHATTANPAGQYVGTAVLTFVGHQKKAYQADVVINPEGQPSYSADGSVHTHQRAQWSFPELESTIECYEHTTFVPISGDPSRYSVVNQCVLFNGAGVFSDAYGKVIGSGVFSLAEGTISMVGEGRVCDLNMK
jgi:hypothetical protein